MKTYARQLIALIFLSAILFLINSSVNTNPPPLATKSSSALPANLAIPAINVDAVVEHVGVNVNGDMEVPSNTENVGWFKIGYSPGDKGSAVIAGHLDGRDGKTGVFNNLHKLKRGDKLFVHDSKGKVLVFVVRESRIYDPGYAEEVFSLNDSAHLNLVTCDGVWDKDKKIYTKRLVVFADISN